MTLQHPPYLSCDIGYSSQWEKKVGFLSWLTGSLFLEKWFLLILLEHFIGLFFPPPDVHFTKLDECLVLFLWNGSPVLPSGTMVFMTVQVGKMLPSFFPRGIFTRCTCSGRPGVKDLAFLKGAGPGTSIACILSQSSGGKANPVSVTFSPGGVVKAATSQLSGNFGASYGNLFARLLWPFWPPAHGPLAFQLLPFRIGHPPTHPPGWLH